MTESDIKVSFESAAEFNNVDHYRQKGSFNHLAANIEFEKFPGIPLLGLSIGSTLSLPVEYYLSALSERGVSRDDQELIFAKIIETMIEKNNERKKQLALEALKSDRISPDDIGNDIHGFLHGGDK